MASKAPRRLIRPLVQALHPYVPGEQPKVKGLVKLNTNENPYPPAPGVRKAIRQAADGRLRLYPNPTAQPLREKLARLHRCQPEQIIVGNGSDELLAMAVRCFVEPVMNDKRRPGSRDVVQFFSPGYSLYPVLAAIHGARINDVSLRPDFALPTEAELNAGKLWDRHAALSLITTPNAPTGRGYSTRELRQLCTAQHGVVVLDEAYVDFARENALSLALELPNVLVARTFSKAYSLCFQRIGYFVGHPALIQALDKIRDSYNVNGLGQIAALATLDHLPYYRKNFGRIIATRETLARNLSALGFHVFPSETNFLLVRPPKYSAQQWLEKLRARKILVRWFQQPTVRDYLRITVGTPAEAGALLRAAQAVLSRRKL
jgi:histidinol-phosphate aminotransferase